MVKVWLNTRGFGPDKGFAWARVDSASLRPEAPPNEYGLDAYVDGTTSSLVVARRRGAVAMLAADMPSERQDSRERSVRNSVFLVAEGSQGEVVARSMAVRWLSGTLAHDVDTCIDRDDTKPLGFTADVERLEKLIHSTDAAGGGPEATTDIEVRELGIDAQQQLAQELASRRLPSIEGVVVAVTGAAPGHLRSEPPWRALYRGVEKRHTPKAAGGPGERVPNPRTRTAITLALAVLALIVLLMLFV